MGDTLNKEGNIGYKLRLLHNQLHNRMEYKTKQCECVQEGLTRMQRFTIGFLYRHSEEEIYQKHLETEFAISRATASNMLSVMERKGLITREAVAHDARLKQIVLTERAKNLHRQIEEDIRETENLLTKGMSEEDRQQLHQYLDVMIQNMVADTIEYTTICCENDSK